MFVGREKELRRLQHFLDLASAGQAQVCFVAGEAGAGKSALVNEFVRCTEETDANVISAMGECNAQTGFWRNLDAFHAHVVELHHPGDDAQARPRSGYGAGLSST